MSVTPSKLYIYDRTSEADRKQAEGRFQPGTVVVLAVDSVEHLHNGLKRLVSDGYAFNKALFQTHGAPGEIKFQNESIWHYLLERDFTGQGYEKLFPTRTKIYFDGCNVGKGDMGWKFLESAGKAFLRLQGGITVGFASYGYGYSSWVPFIGGHTVHFSGGLKYIEFGVGGVESSRFSADDNPSLAAALNASVTLNSY